MLLWGWATCSTDLDHYLLCRRNKPAPSKGSMVLIHKQSSDSPTPQQQIVHKRTKTIPNTNITASIPMVLNWRVRLQSYNRKINDNLSHMICCCMYKQCDACLFLLLNNSNLLRFFIVFLPCYDHWKPKPAKNILPASEFFSPLSTTGVFGLMGTGSVSGFVRMRGTSPLCLWDLWGITVTL